jgi:hypothetical protein
VIQVRKQRKINQPQRSICWWAGCGRRRFLRSWGPAPYSRRSPPRDRLSQRRQEACQPGLPHPVAQIQATPPPTSRASVSWTMGTQCSSLMLGSAVSSSTPNDLQPNSHKGWRLIRRSASMPCQHRRAWRTPRWECKGRWTR